MIQHNILFDSNFINEVVKDAKKMTSVNYDKEDGITICYQFTEKRLNLSIWFFEHDEKTLDVVHCQKFDYKIEYELHDSGLTTFYNFGHKTKFKLTQIHEDKN